MKVLVIGGTGAFGARLCDLLARDGHEVTIASRTPPQGVTHGLDLSGFAHRVFDRSAQIDGFEGFDVIVDAAGPFHAYGDDPYRIARAAIAARASYFDLCDNADFCSGISALHDEAHAAGVAVYSGMSSVPALSSAVVTALSNGTPPLMIDSAIVPGNKAPRGRSVVHSILDQAGRSYAERRGGTDVAVRAWSDPLTYDLGGLKRQAWRIEVPDQRLFPAHFNCGSVSFRAGLELGVMRYGLGLISLIRARFAFPIGARFVSAMMLGARAMAPFGSDTGGMIVNVIVRGDTAPKHKSWVLRATKGDGPYTPAIAVRAACRDISALPIGAGPAVSVVPLAAIEPCFDDLSIETETVERPIGAVFRTVLGDDLDALPPAVRDTHDNVSPRVFRGKSKVTRGSGLLARMAQILFNFPGQTPDIDVEVRKTPQGGAETWVRRFGRDEFVSHLRPTARGMSERFGVFTFDLDLHVSDEKLHFPVKGGRVLGVPIPRFMLPQSIASEAEIDGTFHFDVHLKTPFGGTIVHYQGWLKPIS